MNTGTLEAVSNAATWTEIIEFYDDEDGLPFDIADVEEITIKLRDQVSGATVLEGSLSGGELVAVGDDADGTVEFTFSADDMAGLNPKTYTVGCLIEDEDGVITQVILGSLSVLEGL